MAICRSGVEIADHAPAIYVEHVGRDGTERLRGYHRANEGGVLLSHPTQDISEGGRAIQKDGNLLRLRQTSCLTQELYSELHE